VTATLLDVWQSATNTDTTAIVVPDGCRDLIVRKTPGEKPYWFLSSLDDYTYEVSIQAGVFMQGLRLKPGTRIDEEQLLASVQHQDLELNALYCRIDSYSHQLSTVIEALECLESDVGSVAAAAKQLGMSERTLQRLMMRETGRSPTYWIQLARIRRAARAMHESLPLVEIAFMHGYADQAHISCEFTRWLNISHTRLRADSRRLDLIDESGSY
jgi:AraC-like DNA-binding protein